MREISSIGTIIIAVLILAAKVIHDYWRIVKLKKKIYHGLELVIVLIAYTALAWLSGAFRLPYYGFTIACYLFTQYFALHDPVLNKLRGKQLFYLGTTSWFDRKLAGTPHPQFRIFAFAVAIALALLITINGKSL